MFIKVACRKRVCPMHELASLHQAQSALARWWLCGMKSNASEEREMRNVISCSIPLKKLLTHGGLTHSCLEISLTYVVWTCDIFKITLKLNIDLMNNWRAVVVSFWFTILLQIFLENVNCWRDITKKCHTFFGSPIWKIVVHMVWQILT